MKTKLLSLTIGLMLCGIFSFGGGLEIKFDEKQYIDNIPFDTKQIFRQNITYPEFARKMNIEGVVFVCFTYNEDGYIEIICTNSSHEEFNEYIIEQLSNIRLRNGSVKIGKEYFAKFDFKIL